MTRIPRPGLPDLIRWNPGDPPDWETPDQSHTGGTYCGNCGLDTPGCGCPRGVLRDAVAQTADGSYARLLATWVAELRSAPLLSVTLPPRPTDADHRRFRQELARAGMLLSPVEPEIETRPVMQHSRDCAPVHQHGVRGCQECPCLLTALQAPGARYAREPRP